MLSNVCMKCAYLFNKEQSIEECIYEGTNDAYFFCSQLKYYMASSLCHSLIQFGFMAAFEENYYLT